MIYSNIIWKDIPGYEGVYQASNTGLIKSLGRRIEKVMYGGKISSYFRKESILKPGVLRGYTHVVLRKDNKSKVFKTHRLIAMTFKMIDDFEKYQINHINGIKDDNHVDNLEWVTPQENQHHKSENLMTNKSSKHLFIVKSGVKWRLRGYNSKHIGYFNTEEEAKEVRDELFITNPELFKNDLF